MPSLVITRSPTASLIVLFLAWKLLLLAIAYLSPGPGYDTSTQLLFRSRGFGDLTLPLKHDNSQSITRVPVTGASLWLLQALTRWDAIYFASISERGYILEQEWAFGWGFTRLLSFLATKFPIVESKLFDAIIYGVMVANASHLISVLVLYQLAQALPLASGKHASSLAFIAAVLHILSPAGIFLVAPYMEATFSLLNFTGQLFYVYSWGHPDSQSHGLAQDLCLLLCGISFGLSATVRGNGLLSGIILFHDAVLWLGLRLESLLNVRVVSLGLLPQAVQAELKTFDTRRIPATIVAGLCVAIGFVTPQFIAYQEFCGAANPDPRPWCFNIPPSIFSFVQKHYWNVGFLRYWTLSNLPLFMIAAPLLYTLLSSSWMVLNGKAIVNDRSTGQSKTSKHQNTRTGTCIRTSAILFRLALPQLALASAALTSFHVQIITRLSSGYPVWYMTLARDVMEDKWTTKWTIRWIVMYAIIQAALFVSFLPPA